MNRNQVIELLSTIQSLYPNFKVENKTFTVNAWFEMLKDCDYCMIQQGLQVFAKTDKSGFAPSIGQLIDKAQMSHKPSELNELEAWSLVSNALRNGIYKPAEEFTKLPPLVQKAVGSIDNLRHWAESDIKTIETVIQSNLIRTYRAVVSQSHDVYKMSDDEKQKLHLIQLISTHIRNTALANKSKTSETISNELIANIDMMNEIKQLLEEIGYDISLDVITTPFLPEKAVYTFHISWEM